MWYYPSPTSFSALLAEMWSLSLLAYKNSKLSDWKKLGCVVKTEGTAPIIVVTLLFKGVVLNSWLIITQMLLAGYTCVILQRAE